MEKVQRLPRQEIRLRTGNNADVRHRAGAAVQHEGVGIIDIQLTAVHRGIGAQFVQQPEIGVAVV